LDRIEIGKFESILPFETSNGKFIFSISELNELNRSSIQLSIFDIKSLSHPILIHRDVITEGIRAWPNSTVTWDLRHLRWLSFDEGISIISLPLKIVSLNARRGSKNNFDGYMIYNISHNDISRLFNVSHVETEKLYECYYQAFLPERTLYYNENIISLKGHSVVAKSLSTGIEKWHLSMPLPSNKDDCMFWFF
jgi:hypothetical protein